jgi:hypothetical protein
MPIPDIFGYQPPNDDTRPRHARVDAAVDACVKVFSETLDDGIDPYDVLTVSGAPKATGAQFAAITDACRALVESMEDVCPPSADLSASIRCVRLARMFANNALVAPGGRLDSVEDRRQALLQLKQARFQAKACIALATPTELLLCPMLP